MKDQTQFEQSRSAIGRASTSSISGLTGRFLSWMGGITVVAAIGRFLRQQLWAWPLIAAGLVGGVGWWVNRSVEDALRQQRINELTTILEADLAALRIWMADQRTTAELIASDEPLRLPVQELLVITNEKLGADRELVIAKAQAEIRSRLSNRLKLSGHSGFFLVSRTGVVLAADQDAAIGQTLTGYRKEFFDRTLDGSSVVSKPHLSPILLADENGQLRANLPIMFAAAPIKDDDGQTLAALGLCIRPENQFTRILQVARSGETGETYAFDRNGLILSQSRFDESLKQIGLLVDQQDSYSILNLEIRDPQVNMMEGERPTIRRSEQRLTRMAADAVQGHNGVDAEGYRDYRGVPVVGAWRWLDDYDFGVTTEIDVVEAFRAVYILRWSFSILIALLILFAAAIFLAMVFIARQQSALQKARLAAKHLGQYTLEEKLGSGGMGTVYKARHAMLRRPTAVKLLDLEKMNTSGIARFEREVQLTSALTHPNTVAVFDYGRTPEGIFYYAMEYLDGINLHNLVTRFGPLPEARVLHILRQVCGSLAEAHAAGLVHRDIKPANIFLTCRGGVHDFVKVLDFGLVKALDGQDQANLTCADAVTGTPLYLSPEAVNDPRQVDARADIYAVGAVAYFLLTGSPLFTGATVFEILTQHLQKTPETPSTRIGKVVSPGLESLILRCVAKSPRERPENASALLHELQACVVEGSWTSDQALAWWSESGADIQILKSMAGATIRSVSTPIDQASQITATYDEERD